MTNITIPIKIKMNMEKFDGIDKEKLKLVKFSELSRFERFFIESGEGFCKQGPNTCCNDYALRPIYIDNDREVYIK